MLIGLVATQSAQATQIFVPRIESVQHTEFGTVTLKKLDEIRIGGTSNFAAPLPNGMPDIFALPGSSGTTLPNTTLPNTTGTTGTTTGTTLPFPSTTNPFPSSPFPSSPFPSFPMPGQNPFDPMSINSWITVGERIWNLVSSGKPVVNAQNFRVSVLPNRAEEWAQMEGWQGPSVHQYEVSVKNLAGMEMVKYRYSVMLFHGGNLNGKGKFISNLTVIPSAASAGFSFSFDSRAEVGDPVNAGTKENPVPGVILQIHYTISSLVKKSQGVWAYLVTGEGQVKHLNPN